MAISSSTTEPAPAAPPVPRSELFDIVAAYGGDPARLSDLTTNQLAEPTHVLEGQRKLTGLADAAKREVADYAMQHADDICRVGSNPARFVRGFKEARRGDKGLTA